MDSTRWRPRTGLMMIAVVLLPVAGLLAVTVNQVVEASEHRREVREVHRLLDELITHIELGGRISDEKHWGYAVDSLERLGVERAFVVDLVGVDPWSEAEKSRAEVDRAAGDAGAADVLEEIRALRDADLDPLESNQRYSDIEVLVDARRDAATSQLVDLPREPELSAAIRTLQTAAALRDDTAMQLAAFFGLRFAAELSPQQSMQQLIAREQRYSDDRAELVAMVQPGSRAATALEEIDRDENVALFAGEVRDSVEQTLDSGAEETSRLEIEEVIRDGSALTRVFSAADASLGAHMDLVEAAAEDVTAHAAVMDSAAAADVQRALVVGIVVPAASIVAAILLGRTIVVPLRRMSAVADAMRQGALDERAKEGGPREVRSAARALNEAGAQLQLSERQALALARGDLHDPVLETPAPGALGRSLREAVSQLASSLTEREEYRRRLAHEAAHDGLTGLPNRTASLAHVARSLGRAERTGDMLAVLLVDIDAFKQINEVHGHWAGDRVLVQAARRLTSAVRQGDVVGRLGGDEFIVIAEPVGDDEEAAALAERLVAEIGADMSIGGVQLTCGASVGISISAGGADPDTLIREADAAVAEAKRQGRGRVSFCDDDLRTTLASRTAVERGLAAAMENDELTLYFQQLVDARTEQPVSMEALVRWIHPERGMIPPSEFIPVAEASDLIVTLDRWVLVHAARQLAEWGDDPDLRGLTLAVNLSERHLGHPHLVDHVLHPLRDAGVDPGRLIIEVTETALLDDLTSAATQLSTLRTHGVKVAIDDFGTGYTSLAHLRALPVDVLKIDQSFVANLVREDERSLVRMMIEVGHLFGLEVVAEGVESATEAHELLRLGVDTLQGFHFSRPAPAPQLVDREGLVPATRNGSAHTTANGSRRNGTSRNGQALPGAVRANAHGQQLDPAGPPHPTR